MSESVIVVGVDGSEGSRRALRWAAEEARLRGCAVQAVTTWPPRGTPDDLPAGQAEEHRRIADETLRHVVDGVLRGDESPPALSYDVVRGDPVEVLVHLSARATLLVVGSHGTTSLRHAMLGSVSEACARMANCPVVVLPQLEPVTERAELATAGDEPDAP